MKIAELNDPKLVAELQDAGITELLPTQDELPCSDGVPMETQRHRMQMELLIDSLQSWLDERQDGYVGGDMFVYFSPRQIKSNDFRGPDVFVVLGVPKGERKSWVGWEEGKLPDVVIELLSPSTSNVDKGEKKEIYAQQLRVPEYFWYDPFNPEDWAGFKLHEHKYVPLALNVEGRLESDALGLHLTRWQGQYKGVNATWLRWMQPGGTLLLTPYEQERQLAMAAREQAELAQQQAELAQQQAAAQAQQIALNLLQRGMTAEEVAAITGLERDRLSELSSEC